MDNGQLDPIEDFEPAGPPLPVEIGGPETRLTGPPGPPTNVAPASEPPSFTRLLELLAAHPLARIMQPNGRLGWYAPVMDDPFAAYDRELELRDLDPKTRLQYAQIVSAYRRWLGSGEVNPETAKGFLAHLRQRSYRPSSIALYYTVLKMFLDFLGLKLIVKLRKPQVLPPVYDPGGYGAPAGRGGAGQPASKRGGAPPQSQPDCHLDGHWPPDR